MGGRDEYVGESFTTTLRGQFWVNHLLTIPYPVESYAIPGE